MNESRSDMCIIINDLLDISQNQRNILSAFYIIIGVTGTLMNTVPFYIVIKTKQQRNPSSRLAFYLSMSDMCRSSLGYLMFGVEIMTEFKYNLDCWVKQVLISPLIVFSMSSAYLHCLIILDRFFRIVFIHNYNAFMTTSKFCFIMLTYAILVILQFALTVIGALFTDWNMAGILLTLPMNLVLFLSSIFLHLKSIRLLHNHQKTICLTLGSRNILKLATVYLVVFLAFYAPLMIANLLVTLNTLHILTERTVANVIVITLAISTFSCPVNAVAFVIKNIQARKVIRKHYDRLRMSKIKSSNRVASSGPSVS
jgi:Serpentine type 7TM GPCR chemoreceptor Srx.